MSFTQYQILEEACGKKNTVFYHVILAIDICFMFKQ